MCTAPISTGRPTLALMERISRDFSRDAPGRIRNSATTIINSTVVTRRLEEKSFTAPSREVWGASPDRLECSSPASLIEEMQNYLAQKQQTIAPCGLAILVVRSFKRPVDKHRPSNDIFFGNKSPVPAV